jgi:soluble lytic murein transglycosylase-like protein
MRPPAAAAAACDAMPEAEYAPILEDAARRHSLSAGLLRAVVRQESAFRPCAVSPKGAQGLMQLMPATAERFGVRNPFDPEENVMAGAQFLKELLGRYNGELKLALGAYNAGPGNVTEEAGLPAFPETRNYVEAVLRGAGLSGVILPPPRASPAIRPDPPEGR